MFQRLSWAKKEWNIRNTDLARAEAWKKYRTIDIRCIIWLFFGFFFYFFFMFLSLFFFLGSCMAIECPVSTDLFVSRCKQLGGCGIAAIYVKKIIYLSVLWLKTYGDMTPNLNSCEDQNIQFHSVLLGGNDLYLHVHHLIRSWIALKLFFQTHDHIFDWPTMNRG